MEIPGALFALSAKNETERTIFSLPGLRGVLGPSAVGATAVQPLAHPKQPFGAGMPQHMRRRGELARRRLAVQLAFEQPSQPAAHHRGFHRRFRTAQNGEAWKPIRMVRET